MKLVANVLTPSNRADVGQALTLAIQGVLEEPPSRAWVRVLEAQSAIETLRWRAMHDDNLVNLRGSYRGEGTTFKAGELDAHGHEIILPAGAPGNTFRAYPSLNLAAQDFVRFIFTQSRADRPNRYAAAADCARAGDVVGYVNNLRGPNLDGSWTINGERLGGFFTAVPHVYLVGCVKLCEEFEAADNDDEPELA